MQPLLLIALGPLSAHPHSKAQTAQASRMNMHPRSAQHQIRGQSPVNATRGADKMLRVSFRVRRERRVILVGANPTQQIVASAGSSQGGLRR